MGIKRIKIAVLGLILGLLVGCTSSAVADGQSYADMAMYRHYDADYGVVCYGRVMSDGGISCVQVHAPNK